MILRKLKLNFLFRYNFNEYLLIINWILLLRGYFKFGAFFSLYLSISCFFLYGKSFEMSFQIVSIRKRVCVCVFMFYFMCVCVCRLNRFSQYIARIQFFRELNGKMGLANFSRKSTSAHQFCLAVLRIVSGIFQLVVGKQMLMTVTKIELLIELSAAVHIIPLI